MEAIQKAYGMRLMKLTNMKSSTEFFKDIDLIVREKSITYFEAVIHYCEVNNLEVETAASLIKQNGTLKAKIQIDAENVNMVKRTGSKLPI
jgi:hypothetical protein